MTGLPGLDALGGLTGGLPLGKRSQGPLPNLPPLPLIPTAVPGIQDGFLTEDPSDEQLSQAFVENKRNVEENEKRGLLSPNFSLLGPALASAHFAKRGLLGPDTSLLGPTLGSAHFAKREEPRPNYGSGYGNGFGSEFGNFRQGLAGAVPPIDLGESLQRCSPTNFYDRTILIKFQVTHSLQTLLSTLFLETDRVGTTFSKETMDSLTKISTIITNKDILHTLSTTITDSLSRLPTVTTMPCPKAEKVLFPPNFEFEIRI